MAGSIDRVMAAAKAAGLEIEIRRMGASTRTAEEAAEQCGCVVDQIVKSLIFQGEASGKLYLFMVSGSSRLDLQKAAALAGEALKRAEPRFIRDRTGFAIGGVSPIGYLKPIPTFADEKLLKPRSRLGGRRCSRCRLCGGTARAAGSCECAAG